ncbi:hypothetical protein D9M69_384120 [compost metagenome]
MHDGLAWRPARADIDVHFLDEDDGVADDHANQGDDAELRHEAHGRSGRQHGQDHSDQAERCHRQGEEHPRETAQLQHQQHAHHEGGHRQYGGQRGAPLRGFLDGAAGFDLVALGQAGGKLRDGGRERLHDGRRLDALTNVALNGDQRETLPPPDDRILDAVAEPGNLRQRDGKSLGRADLQVGQGREARALTDLRADDHVNETILVAHGGHGRAREDRRHGTGDLLGGKPQRPCLRLVDGDDDAPLRLARQQMHLAGIRVGREQVGELSGQVAHLALVGSRDAVLEGPADRRAELEWCRPRDEPREFRLEQPGELGLQCVTLLDALGNHHRLGHIVVLQQHLHREVEADRTGTYIGREQLDTGVFLEQLLELQRLPLRRLQRRVLRQRQADQELRTVGGREELLFELARGDKRQREGHASRGKRDRAMPQGPGQGTLVEPHDPAVAMAMIR